MNKHPLNQKILRRFLELNPNSYLARLSLRYLLRWGLEKKSFRHQIALTYLLNKGFRTNSLVDRLALTYVLNRGLKKDSLVARLVRAYLGKRGLAKQSLFDPMACALKNLLTKGDKTNTLLEKMALIYFVKRCDEAVDKGVSVSGWGGVFRLAQVEGINLINRNFKVLVNTPGGWQTAKTAVAFRSIKALYQENTDEFRYNAELGYWTAALESLYHVENVVRERLRHLEKEENLEDD
uniref:Uncharacterized protein n=1 Tax=Downingia cuspidata TaxID=101772 RepID=A0A1Z2QT06_9ASTR|nr:hypothetical protein Do_cus1Pt0612 [Downingia cuspidata]ASA34622.1 hypothetical protein Do_cus1Pt0612 [Downingia cuspidata]